MRFGARGPSLGAVLLLVAVVALLIGDDESAERGSRERAERPARDRSQEGSSPDRHGEGPGVMAPVVDIVDGDTIEVLLDGEEEDVRYIGVDTPESVAPGEPVECYGKAASRFNARLVAGRTVRLLFDAERRDHYGRLLAYVYVGDLFVNAELVEHGYARTLEIEPNTSRASRLNRLEAEAGRTGRGLWSACGP